MVAEIHRQWDTIPGLKEGKENAKTGYDKCIDIATTGSLKELIPAGLVAIFSTILVGFIGGASAIGGFLTGNITSGLLLALLMSNAGGLWDNSKKYVEAGNCGGKGSTAHKAAVVGDTVGDPFKDTAVLPSIRRLPLCHWFLRCLHHCSLCTQFSKKAKRICFNKCCVKSLPFTEGFLRFLLLRLKQNVQYFLHYRRIISTQTVRIYPYICIKYETVTSA